MVVPGHGRRRCGRHPERRLRPHRPQREPPRLATVNAVFARDGWRRLVERGCCWVEGAVGGRSRKLPCWRAAAVADIAKCETAITRFTPDSPEKPAGTLSALAWCVAQATVTYQPRDPTQDVLHVVVRDHAETFRQQAASR